MTFTFDSVLLCGLPTQAGLVWTDVYSDVGSVTFEAFDVNRNSLGVIVRERVGDGDFLDSTGEDRFFGVSYASGIWRITMTMDHAHWEIDHLQYGRALEAACIGDLNGDRVVNGFDLATLLAEMGSVCARSLPGRPRLQRRGQRIRSGDAVGRVGAVFVAPLWHSIALIPAPGRISSAYGWRMDRARIVSAGV